MREIKRYGYDQTTYSVKDFKNFTSKSPHADQSRVDVDFVTNAKSKAEAIRKFMATPAVNQSANWIRERLTENKIFSTFFFLSEARSKVDLIVTDDGVYCFTDSHKYMGKYLDGKWHPTRIKKYRVGFRSSIGTSFDEMFLRDLMKAVRSGAEDIFFAQAIDHDTFEIHTLIKEKEAS